MKFSTKVKALWYGMDFSHGIRRALILSLALVYFVQAGYNVVWVTTLFAFSSAAMIFLELPTGAIADYDSRKKSLMIFYLLTAIAFLGIFISNSFWLIAIFWVLSDIAWTFHTGASSAWAIDALGIGKKKPKIVKLISSGYIFEKGGHVIGGLIGLIIIAISFRLIWLVAGLISLGMFLIIWRHMEERNFKPSKIPHGYIKKSLIKAKESYDFILHKKSLNLRIIMLTDIFANIGFAILYLAIPLFFVQVIMIEPEFYSGILSVVAILAIAGPIMAAKSVGKRGFGKSLFLISGIIGILAISIAYSNWIVLAVALFAMIQIFVAMLDVTVDSASHHEFDSKIRASLGSIGSINWNISNSIGIFLGGLSIGLLGIVNTLIASGAIIFLTGFIYLLMRE